MRTPALARTSDVGYVLGEWFLHCGQLVSAKALAEMVTMAILMAYS